jgi:hypothetical protein
MLPYLVEKDTKIVNSVRIICFNKQKKNIIVYFRPRPSECYGGQITAEQKRKALKEGAKNRNRHRTAADTPR